MAQSWRVKHHSHKRPAPPLDEAALERLALVYVGRYATTRARLRSYLGRKLRERGWDGAGAAPIEPLIEKMVRLNYVNDEAYALARAASLRRRGLGGRRADQLFRAAGIADEDSAEARREMREGALAGALRFAERRKIGPYALEKADLRQREKAFAAMIRAGHDLDVTRRVLAMGPDDIPLCDSDQYS